MLKEYFLQSTVKLLINSSIFIEIYLPSEFARACRGEKLTNDDRRKLILPKFSSTAAKQYSD